MHVNIPYTKKDHGEIKKRFFDDLQRTEYKHEQLPNRAAKLNIASKKDKKSFRSRGRYVIHNPPLPDEVVSQSKAEESPFGMFYHYTRGYKKA